MSANTFARVQAKLIQLIETEGANWTKSWVGSSRPANYLSKKPYRGLNYFWLAVQGYDSHEWGTWKQWTDKGYKVKKDQRKQYTNIFFSQVKEKKESWLTPEEKAKYRASGKLPTYWCWARYNVYNAEQIENYTPEIADHEAKTELTEAETLEIDAFFQATGAVINHGGDEAYYQPSTDQIFLPNKSDFHSDVDYYSTKGHELTHWTANPKRLDRDLSRALYAQEELIAEIGSAMLCAELGIEKTVRADHAQYINGWLEAIRDNEKAMTHAFSAAQKAFDYLMSLAKENTDAADKAA
tara:strand:- start:13206 stop:14096 length:891 start_codon:yes stop_codon:yes gene_type:complete